MHKHIYALCAVPGEPFYVGITGNMQQRLREHRYASAGGTEAKYQYIRQLEAAGLQWEMLLLETVGPDCDRWEDYWVYSLIMEGYPLQNQKAGDSVQAAERDVMLEMRQAGHRYSCAQDFLAAREAAVAEAAARAQAAALRTRTRCTHELSGADVHRTVTVGENPHSRFTSPAIEQIKRRIYEKRMGMGGDHSNN